MIKSIAVDDELRALELIESHVSKIESLELQKKFRNPVEAIEYLTHNQIDLIFLDINMPNIDGIEFSKIIGKKSLIIFTTAHSDFAVESYEVEAFDYLLKPISFNRFVKSILKAEKFLNKNIDQIKAEESFKNNRILLKNAGNTYNVSINKIKFIEAMGNYIKVYLENDQIIGYMSLKKILHLLPIQDFIRVHKSYIVSKKFIDSFYSYQIKIGNKEIPIGKHYRKNFHSLMLGSINE